MVGFSPLFLSHGAPTMGLSDAPVRHFMEALGKRLPKPEAAIVVSAHFETRDAVVVSDPSPDMIYDFGNFDPRLFEQVYLAPGQPELAREVLDLIEKIGLPVNVLDKRGFDHGTWVPLQLVWPEADVPIVQLSIDPEQDAKYHYKLGQALSSLPQRNIAIIGSGNITHNLRALFQRGHNAELDANIRQWVDEFLLWYDFQIESKNLDNLLNYREKAPFAKENHPTDEHLMPIYVALGAAGKDWRGNKLHQSYDYEFLAMDAWEFKSGT